MKLKDGLTAKINELVKIEIDEPPAADCQRDELEAYQYFNGMTGTILQIDELEGEVTFNPDCEDRAAFSWPAAELVHH